MGLGEVDEAVAGIDAVQRAQGDDHPVAIRPHFGEGLADEIEDGAEPLTGRHRLQQLNVNESPPT